MSESHPLLYKFPTQIGRSPDGAMKFGWPAGSDAFASGEHAEGNDALHTLRGHSGVFTREECSRIIALGEASNQVPARVELGDDAYRVSRISWIQPGGDTQWLYNRLGMLLAETGRELGLELTGFVDPLQYTMYGAGQHFDWHMDLGPGSTSTRKLSLTIQLSDAVEYAGGNLEFITARHVQPLREIGSATFFPAYLAHRVSAVESGVRRSLVAWACGPAFR